MLYSGDGNDINDASYKLSKLALRNTPSKSPEQYKTAEEREALKNEGKAASIINLVDEIDTTMFVITDKLDDINTDSSLTGGMKIARKPKGKSSKGKSSKGKKDKVKMDEIEEVYDEDERPMRKASKFETVDNACCWICCCCYKI